MPVCVNCRLTKPGVKLCDDDLLCPDCFYDNECKLAELKKQHTLTISSVALPAGAESTNKTRASKSRQVKAKNQPIPHTAASSSISADPHEANNDIPKQQHPMPQQPSAHSADLTAMPAMPPATLTSAVSTQVIAEDISALHLLLQEQQLTIDALQRQLNFVLGFLGITDFNSLVTMPAIGDCAISSGATTVLSESATNSPTTHSSRTKYSTMVSQGDMTKPSKNITAFQQAVLTTVASENRRKIARQANVIISGLPACSQKTDAELAQQLFTDELMLHCNIVSCQRLGKSSPGKTQLLKVCMSGTNEAADVLSAAKRLRHSTDDYICHHVYINKDMTKSEAELAYRERCRRREIKQQRQLSTQPSPPSNGAAPPCTNINANGGRPANC